MKCALLSRSWTISKYSIRGVRVAEGRNFRFSPTPRWWNESLNEFWSTAAFEVVRRRELRAHEPRRPRLGGRQGGRMVGLVAGLVRLRLPGQVQGRPGQHAPVRQPQAEQLAAALQGRGHENDRLRRRRPVPGRPAHRRRIRQPAVRPLQSARGRHRSQRARPTGRVLGQWVQHWSFDSISVPSNWIQWSEEWVPTSPNRAKP